jgi:crossover junction endodeoxyribonuclease RusA
MRIELTPPDNRKRDIDNCFKALLDSLEGAAVFINDSQVKELHAVMLPKGDGQCLVMVTELQA